jgi:hypothetical protein
MYYVTWGLNCNINLYLMVTLLFQQEICFKFEIIYKEGSLLIYSTVCCYLEN